MSTREPSDRQAIRDGVAAVCKRFDDEYWAKCDEDARFPSSITAPWRRPAGSASPCRRNTAARASA